MATSSLNPDAPAFLPRSFGYWKKRGGDGAAAPAAAVRLSPVRVPSHYLYIEVFEDEEEEDEGRKQRKIEEEKEEEERELEEKEEDPSRWRVDDRTALACSAVGEDYKVARLARADGGGDGDAAADGDGVCRYRFCARAPWSQVALSAAAARIRSENHVAFTCAFSEALAFDVLARTAGPGAELELVATEGRIVYTHTHSAKRLDFLARRHSSSSSGGGGGGGVLLAVQVTRAYHHADVDLPFSDCAALLRRKLEGLHSALAHVDLAASTGGNHSSSSGTNEGIGEVALVVWCPTKLTAARVAAAWRRLRALRDAGPPVHVHIVAAAFPRTPFAYTYLFGSKFGTSG